MAPKRNNIIPNGHFHKNWQHSVKNWFKQPARKLKRHLNRVKKASMISPRPSAGPLQPIVRCPTVRYNTKARRGRGFTLQELKSAGFNAAFARSFGISVDYRRRNKSVESIQLNAQLLKEYRSKLIVFPKNNKKAQQSKEEQVATQQKGKVLPIKQGSVKLKARVPMESEKRFSAFSALKKARADAYLMGIRAKRRKLASENLVK